MQERFFCVKTLHNLLRISDVRTHIFILGPKHIELAANWMGQPSHILPVDRARLCRLAASYFDSVGTVQSNAGLHSHPRSAGCAFSKCRLIELAEALGIQGVPAHVQNTVYALAYR